MHDGEVDVSLRNDVEQVGEDVLGGNGEDFYDLAVTEAGVADRLNVGGGDMPTLAHDLACQPHGGIRLRVAGFALAIEGNLLGADPRQIEPEICVSRQAIIAAVDLATANAIRSRVFTSRVFERA